MKSEMELRRYNREAKARERGTKVSHATESENAKIVAAWLGGSLSEGQASKALGVDRISARVMRDQVISEGVVLFEALGRKAVS